MAVHLSALQNDQPPATVMNCTSEKTRDVRNDKIKSEIDFKPYSDVFPVRR